MEATLRSRDIYTKAKHRSFRLTPPDYMVGMQVKPRLRRIAYFSAICALAMLLLLFVGLIELARVPILANLWALIVLGICLPRLLI